MSFKKIKVFLSSTFRDMGAERDHLIKVVFPRVAEYCRNRFLEFVPIDLRWGITEEQSRSGLVLTTCMEEIDEARPFFVGILGDRYGWSPEKKDIKSLPSKFREEEAWIMEMVDQGASITEMEIEYGVLREMSISRAAFFIRAEKMKVPDEFHELKGSRKEQKLKRLKNKIRNQKRYPVKEYENPQQLGEQLYRMLIDTIEEEYPKSAFDEEKSLKGIHELSLERRAHTLCDISSLASDFERWINEPNNNILMIEGKPGGGASTALCWGIVNLRKHYPNHKIIYYDIESVSSNISVLEDLKYVISLQIDLNTQEEWAIIAIDNISLLEKEDITNICEWIADHLDKIKYVLSLPEGSLVKDIIKFRFEPCWITINGFTEPQQREYITNFAAQYGKTLTQTQIDKIIQVK